MSIVMHALHTLLRVAEMQCGGAGRADPVPPGVMCCRCHLLRQRPEGLQCRCQLRRRLRGSGGERSQLLHLIARHTTDLSQGGCSLCCCLFELVLQLQATCVSASWLLALWRELGCCLHATGLYHADAGKGQVPQVHCLQARRHGGSQMVAQLQVGVTPGRYAVRAPSVRGEREAHTAWGQRDHYLQSPRQPPEQCQQQWAGLPRDLAQHWQLPGMPAAEADRRWLWQSRQKACVRCAAGYSVWASAVGAAVPPATVWQ